MVKLWTMENGKERDALESKLVENRKACKVMVVGGYMDLYAYGNGLRLCGYQVVESHALPKTEDIQSYGAIVIHAGEEHMEKLIQDLERTPECDHVKVLAITGAGRGRLQDIRGLSRIDDTSQKGESPEDFIGKLDNLLGIS
jgi:hypothetical protein